MGDQAQDFFGGFCSTFFGQLDSESLKIADLLLGHGLGHKVDKLLL